MKKRIDTLLVEKEMLPSREQAQRYIIAGRVWVNGKPVTKPSLLVPGDVIIEVASPKRQFVSRGGEKLTAALSAFEISVRDKVAADIGASTGGFTDCMLQGGARKVYAVDVGYGKLAWSLRQDKRVVVLERVNARYMRKGDLPEDLDLVTIDVSFISLKKIIPAIIPFLRSGGEILALIKPQFEAGRKQVGKGGVVRSEAVQQEVVEEIKRFACESELEVVGTIPSPLLGPAGNREYFIYLKG